MQRASLLSYVHAGSPPFLILQSESDALDSRTQSELLFEALANPGNQASFVRFKGLGHGVPFKAHLDQTEIAPSVTTVSHPIRR